MIFFKIVDVVDGKVKTLFHGIDGSRVLEPNVWYKADKKMCRDGSAGTMYLSGFHVLPSIKQTKDYLSKFSNMEHKKIVSCECKGIREKSHSRSEVYLVDEIKILEIL